MGKSVTSIAHKVTDLKNDVEQVRTEAKKCNKQCTNNESCFSQAQELVNRCEIGVAFMGLETWEQANMLLSNIESLRLGNLRPQWINSEVQELAAGDESSPTRTIETQISEAWCPSNSDESWYADDDEPSLRNDDTSEHEFTG